MTHPVALELAEHVLGASFLLSSFTANIAKNGEMLEPLHRDNWVASDTRREREGMSELATGSATRMKRAKGHDHAAVRRKRDLVANGLHGDEWRHTPRAKLTSAAGRSRQFRALQGATHCGDRHGR